MGTLGAHLNEQVILLLKSFFARLHSILDYHFKFGAVNCKKDIRDSLAIETVPVALVRQVLEGIRGRLGELEHVLNGEALDLWHRGHQDLVPGDVLIIDDLRAETLTFLAPRMICLRKYTLVASMGGRYAWQSCSRKL